MLSSKALTRSLGRRGYFSLVDRFRDTINIPMRHLRSFFELDGQHYTTTLPESPHRLHGNTNMNFAAYLTGNAFDMNQWHEMENTVHTQFGTIDNPVIIFSSDSTWRSVVCMGPGAQEDAYTHERMYYVVREGPLHRCHICGQCFKLVRLKDQYSEINDYYSHMFAPISRFEISEEDLTMGYTSVFSDRPQIAMESAPSQHIYVQVNNDQADHLMVDPAHRLEKTWEAQEKFIALMEATQIVEEKISKIRMPHKIPFNREFYDTWWKIEKSIRKFDRVFNQLERFDGRKLIDPDNHERREKRMIERKRNRWVANYPYFFGGLTEEEQMYRDYYETDVEENPELYNERFMEMQDELEMVSTGDFKHSRFDFREYTMQHEPMQEIIDALGKMIFKYKYRLANDEPDQYMRRMQRVYDRFAQRAALRDPSIEQDLAKLFQKDELSKMTGVLLDEDADDVGEIAQKQTQVTREYMLEESVQQYKDYYESDEEEQKNFELLDNLTPRDRIRMLEIFEDFSRADLTQDGKRVFTIPKRHHDPELSFMKNLYLDLVDFRDRVKPLANDLALMDETSVYQSQPLRKEDKPASKPVQEKAIPERKEEESAQLDDKPVQ